MGKRLVIVEDDDSLSEGLTLLLADEGYDVLRHAEGSSMFEALKRPPDLFILDYRLPGLNGLTIATMLRRDGSPYAPVPILMISATQTDLSTKIRESVIDAYLAKPFAIDEFLSAVRSLTASAPMI